MKVIRMPGTTTDNYKRNFKEETSRWDYLVSQTLIHLRYLKQLLDATRKILEIGYPRNDVLVNRANDQAYIQEIKENLNLPKDKK